MLSCYVICKGDLLKFQIRCGVCCASHEFDQNKRLKKRKKELDEEDIKINLIMCRRTKYRCLTTNIHGLNPVSQRLDQDVPQTAPQNPTTPFQQPPAGLCSRTYITFSDDESFEASFPHGAQSNPQLPVQEVCPVTHKAALYRDPVTDIPYANARAFRIIREAYRKYVAAHGFPNTSGGGAVDSSAMKGARQKMVVKQSTVAT